MPDNVKLIEFVLAQSKVAYATVNPLSMTFDYCSDHFKLIYGDFVNQEFKQFFPKKNIDQAISLLETTGFSEIECERALENGQKKALICSIRLMQQADVSLYVMVIHDKTAVKEKELMLKSYSQIIEKKVKDLEKKNRQIREMQVQLIDSSKLKALGEMAGGIAHEINNPLAAINMTVKTLKKIISRENGDKNLMLECTSDIESTVVRIHDIVTALRTISHNDPDDKREMILLQSIFDDVMRLCSEKLKNVGIELIIEDDNNVLAMKISCNRVSLAQVMINLIQNAHDAILKDEIKWIRINFALAKEMLMIKVIDSGKGISEETAEKIFQPFFSTKDIGKGAGIGLSLSRSMMEKQSGRLHLDEKMTNTCFVIELPYYRKLS